MRITPSIAGMNAVKKVELEAMKKKCNAMATKLNVICLDLRARQQELEEEESLIRIAAICLESIEESFESAVREYQNMEDVLYRRRMGFDSTANYARKLKRQYDIEKSEGLFIQLEHLAESMKEQHEDITSQETIVREMYMELQRKEAELREQRAGQNAMEEAYYQKQYELQVDGDAYFAMHNELTALQEECIKLANELGIQLNPYMPI